MAGVVADRRGLGTGLKVLVDELCRGATCRALAPALAAATYLRPTPKTKLEKYFYLNQNILFHLLLNLQIYFKKKGEQIRGGGARLRFIGLFLLFCEVL